MDVYRGGPVQARIQDFSQGRARFGAERKNFFCPPPGCFLHPPGIV